MGFSATFSGYRRDVVICGTRQVYELERADNYDGGMRIPSFRVQEWARDRGR